VTFADILLPMSFPNFLRGLAVLVVTVPVMLVARQDVSQTYDVSKSVTLTGFVTKITWTDPHVVVYINVREEGRTSNWTLETGSKAELVRTGWTSDKLKVGTEVTVTGNPAKSSPRKAYIVTIDQAKPRIILNAIAE
jgi:hypothetical protein